MSHLELVLPDIEKPSDFLVSVQLREAEFDVLAGLGKIVPVSPLGQGSLLGLQDKAMAKLHQPADGFLLSELEVVKLLDGAECL